MLLAKKTFIFILSFALLFGLIGCKKSESHNSSEVIEITEEIVYEGGESVVSQENQSNSNLQSEQNTLDNQVDSVYTEPVVSSENQTVGDNEEIKSEKAVDINYEWKNHSQDYKLLAFTFDDGPSAEAQRLIDLFLQYEGAGTFFVNGQNIKSDADYTIMQNAINMGWAIGTHGMNHKNALTEGSAGGVMTQQELQYEIKDFTAMLESKLKFADGTPYDITLYRPPNIAISSQMFDVCEADGLSVIWLAHDTHDWDKTKAYSHRFKIISDGVGTWLDGDVILAHIWSDDTYNILKEKLPDFYDAGYRFCSVTELMQLRGISQDKISGRINNFDGNQNMVTNIIKSAKYGKKTD